MAEDHVLPLEGDAYAGPLVEEGRLGLEVVFDSTPLLERWSIDHEMGARNEAHYFAAVRRELGPLVEEGTELRVSRSFVGPAAGDQYPALFHLIGALSDLASLAKSVTGILRVLRELGADPRISESTAVGIARIELGLDGYNPESPVISVSRLPGGSAVAARGGPYPKAGGYLVTFELSPGHYAPYPISIDGRKMKRRLARRYKQGSDG